MTPDMPRCVAEDADLVQVFETQAGHCDRMNAPFNGRICRLLPRLLDETSALGRRVLAWSHDNMAGDLMPLRCCAGFHALARANRVAGLAAVYPPAQPDEAALEARLNAAIAQDDAFLAAYLDSAPQTNEIGRSAILLGGLLSLARRVKFPVALYEIGASAGLNMLFDRWYYDLGAGGFWGAAQSNVRLTSDWTGATPAVQTPLGIVSRAASDLAPLDAGKPAARDRLLSYIWPDQTARLERTKAALDIFAGQGLVVEKADALDWVSRRLQPSSAAPGTVTVLWHSVFLQYLDSSQRSSLVHVIRERGRAAAADRPFAWLQMEAGRENRQQCELRLTLWPGGETVHLADVDWHGRSAHWR